jgi:hypothetical protein
MLVYRLANSRKGDFAISIKIAEEPGNVGEVWTVPGLLLDHALDILLEPPKVMREALGFALQLSLQLGLSRRSLAAHMLEHLSVWVPGSSRAKTYGSELSPIF